MAKPAGTTSNSGPKISFGKKKKRGKAIKLHNKHDRKERNYRGQGR